MVSKEPPLLHETTALNPWQPERDAVALAVLGKFSEELGEAVAIVSRCIIQGIGESEPVTGKPNADALENEIGDVLAGCAIVIAHFGLRQATIDRRIDRKTAHLKAWHRMIND